MKMSHITTCHSQICHLANPDFSIVWTEKGIVEQQKWNVDSSNTKVCTPYSLAPNPELLRLELTVFYLRAEILNHRTRVKESLRKAQKDWHTWYVADSRRCAKAYDIESAYHL